MRAVTKTRDSKVPTASVIVLYRAGQAVADLAEGLPETAQSFEQFLAEGGDFGGILVQGILPPAEGHGAQQGDEGRGGGDDHPMFGANLDEIAVLFEGGGKEMFARQEQDDEFRGRGKLIPIGFGAEFLDMVANHPSMVRQVEAALGLVDRFDGG